MPASSTGGSVSVSPAFVVRRGVRMRRSSDVISTSPAATEKATLSCVLSCHDNTGSPVGTTCWADNGQEDRHKAAAPIHACMSLILFIFSVGFT